MSLLKEFKEFAVKGNVVDMAVGVIIGGAFGKIVSSFVADVIMPPIGILLGGVSFADLAIVLKEAQGETPAVLLKYGMFIQTILDFLIIAGTVFLAIKALNNVKKLRAKEEEKVEAAPAPPPAPTKEEILLTEIRDILKQK
jgi:large conductance mechanosensitive channel